MQTVGNCGRAAYDEALDAARTVFSARQAVSAFFGCPRADHVVFTANITESLNIALNVAKKYPGKAVVFFNLEMSREQMAMRLLANESFVDLQKLVTGQLTEEDWGKLSIASSALSQTDIRVDDNPTITVA